MLDREGLGGGRFVYQSDSCRFGEDALRLAAFAAPKSTDVVCDLGTGGGILPLLFCVDAPPHGSTRWSGTQPPHSSRHARCATTT
ncbi:MAG: hypothetical protein IKI63_05680 [Clostridia bacterium]|nr:hypothetical protein [Clostridia bacterium]